MKTFQLMFYGRRKGALGISYNITETVVAPDLEAACQKLYDNYEHINVWKSIELDGAAENTTEEQRWKNYAETREWKPDADT